MPQVANLHLAMQLLIKGYSCFLSSSTLFLVSFLSGSSSPLARTAKRVKKVNKICDTKKVTYTKQNRKLLTHHCTVPVCILTLCNLDVNCSFTENISLGAADKKKEKKKKGEESEKGNALASFTAELKVNWISNAFLSLSI